MLCAEMSKSTLAEPVPGEAFGGFSLLYVLLMLSVGEHISDDAAERRGDEWSGAQRQMSGRCAGKRTNRPAAVNAKSF
jgi:hypothetical protein